MYKENKLNYILLLIVIYLFVFEFALQILNPIFGYWDELYAALFFPLWLMKSRIIFKKNSYDSKLFLFLCLYILIGLLSNWIYKYQKTVPILLDIFLNCKFFLGIYTTVFLFEDLDINLFKRKIKYHVKLIVSVLTVLVLINYLVKIFPYDDIRYGIPSQQLFYGHPTGLASVSFFLLLLIILLYENTNSDKFYILLCLLLLVSTLRIKAIVTSIVFIYFFWIIVIKKRKLNIGEIILLIIPLSIISWQQIYGYFLSDDSLNTARGALLNRAFAIAKDHFPLGTGFGTYASAPSGSYYSPVYYLYNLNNIWGLGVENPMFVSDSFWPMILGQTGWLGLLVYLNILFILFKKIINKMKYNSNLKMACLGVMIYLLISSMGESAFVNPLSLPLAVILGLSFNEVDQRNIEGYDEVYAS